MVDEHGVQKWEKGLNRLCDLKLMQHEQQTTVLERHDQWNAFSVNFLMYMPLNAGEVMRINGALEALGNWNKGSGPTEMSLSEREYVWLTGERVRPWQLSVVMKQDDFPMR